MFTNTVVHAHIGWKLRNTIIKNLLKATLHHFKINCMTMDVSFKCVPFSSMLNVVKTTINCTYQLINQLSFPREYIHRCVFLASRSCVFDDDKHCLYCYCSLQFWDLLELVVLCWILLCHSSLLMVFEFIGRGGRHMKKNINW